MRGRGAVEAAEAAGDRVKTDARDALHLARLLRLDEVTSVSIPSMNQEAFRDLVRAREDCRGDLMRARHRLSKLLLRHGIVYYGGAAWTEAHDRWLRAQAAPQLQTPATRMAFDSDYEHVLMLQASRRGLDSAIEDIAADSEFTPVVRRMSCLRGVGTFTAFALAVRSATGTGSPATRSVRSSGWCPRSPRRVPHDRRDRSPRPGTLTCAGYWSRRPGITDPSITCERSCVHGGTRHRQRPELVVTRATVVCITSGWISSRGASGPPWPTLRSPVNWPAGAGRWRSWTTDRHLTASSQARSVAARGSTRDTTMSRPDRVDARP